VGSGELRVVSKISNTLPSLFIPPHGRSIIQKEKNEEISKNASRHADV